MRFHRNSGLALRTAVLIGALLALLSACTGTTAETGDTGTPAETGDDALQIVVTTSILGDVVSELVGDDAQVEVLMPPGSDAHSFAISAQGATDIREADLLVTNGLGLEEGMADAIEAASEEGVQIFEATSAIETIPFTAGEEHDEATEDHDDAEDHDEAEGHDDAEDHDHSGDDPHFWLDPNLVGDSMLALVDQIAEIDDRLPDEEWTARGDALAADYDQLATEIDEVLAVIPAERRLLVTNHDAFGYFADAFDFEVVGSILPGGSTLAEASARDIEELVDRIRETGVTAILVDATDSSRLADVVAEQAGDSIRVGTVNTGSLGEPGTPAGTYRGYMTSNASTIVDLLGPVAASS